MEGKSTDWVRGPSGPTVCRCCFAEGCYKDISTEYFWMGKREVYSEMLTETFDLSIAFALTSGPNSNSRLICEPCISRLRDASEFKKQVQECEKMFMQYLDPGRASVSEVEMEVPQVPAEKEVKLEPVKLEKQHSDDDYDAGGGFDDLDDDDLDDQPLTKLASKVPKKESVDLLDLLDNARPEKRKSSTKTKASPAKKAKTKKEAPKATVSKAKPEKKKKDHFEDPTTVKAVKMNAKVILAHSNACPVKYQATDLQCYICNESFNDPTILRAHVDKHTQDEKSSTSLFVFNKYVLIDITDLRCKCALKFDSLDGLVSHLIETHRLNIDLSYSLGLVPLKLEKNRYQCVICSEPLYTLQNLSRHTAMHFYQYTCEICGNKYRTNQRLNFHMRSEHQVKNVSKHFCRRCKISFATAEEKSEHLRISQVCLPYVCQICGERFLHAVLKENHKVTVHNLEKRTYPCIECGKIFKYRTYLSRHFNSTHTDKNKCPYCDKQYCSAAELKGHVAWHTGERPYPCDKCNLRFTCKQTWNRHKVTHDDAKKSACPICKKLFARRYRIKGHIQKNHPEVSIL